MPIRTVHHADGVAWLRAAALPEDAAIVTSLPDHSELPALGFAGWRAWFVETAALACSRVSDTGVVVFYQTDVKHEGVWIDKGYLVSRGAEEARGYAGGTTGSSYASGGTSSGSSFGGGTGSGGSDFGRS